MKTTRTCGVLLHPTSLPGPDGLGTLGGEAYRFLDFLKAAGQKIWQVLPLGPCGYGESPYACFSAVAGNPLLISVAQLAKTGWLRDQAGARNRVAACVGRVSAPAHQRGRGAKLDATVSFRAVARAKWPQLAAAHAGFLRRGSPEQRAAFASFCDAQRTWLEDFALFMAIKESRGGRPWWTWPAALRFRKPGALRQARRQLADPIARQKFYQFAFFQQWDALREHARASGIQVVGDMPIYVARDSADVWAYPEVFLLDAARRPTRVAGVPPDYFSRTGQLWGNPVYNWDRQREATFAWWERRMRANLALFDVVRFDHFLALSAYWGVPYGHRTAMRGAWYPAPGAALLQRLQKAFAGLPMIVEDLGVITPAVRKLRERFGLPGMKILQFAFGGGGDSEYLPHMYTRNFVVYTGTHDNDTTRAWFASAPANVKQHARAYVGPEVSRSAWPFIRLAWQSVADIAIVPMQDVLDLGVGARMNVPGTIGGNWEWRMLPGAASPALARRLRDLTRACGR